MTFAKLCSLGAAALLCVVLWPAQARADEWNQMTELTFSQPVEVPGVVLPAGTYWFKIGPSQANRNIVEIYSSDWRHLYAIRETVPVERAQSTARTELRFAERPRSSPEALLDWFYPGETEGHQFLYSTCAEKEIAHDMKQDVRAAPIVEHTEQARVECSTSPGAVGE